MDFKVYIVYERMKEAVKTFMKFSDGLIMFFIWDHRGGRSYLRLDSLEKDFDSQRVIPGKSKRI